MIRQTARPALLAAAAAALVLAAPLAAQQTFELPPASPSPTPAPAGPADERSGVAIPPRAPAQAAPDTAPAPTATPVVQPLPIPAPTPRQSPPQPAASTVAPARPAPADAQAEDAPLPAAPTAGPTLPEATSAPAGTATAAPGFGTSLDPATPIVGASVLPDWWRLAAGGLAAIAVLAAAAVWRRRRKPKALRLAAPVAGAPAAAPKAQEPPRIDLALEITSATRSVMMFTLEYRLTIANRSDRAVNDLNAAAKLVCARGSAEGAAAGAAQGLEHIARIGPQQARSLTGTLQLPLAAIAPLRQGQTPLFIPLVHITLEGEGLPADTRTFVIGPPSASGRVHPISLDQPPGGIAGLVAQAVAVPAASAAA